ncbi:hypothetical protein WI69_20470 [Burkholderia diffusa]|nr:hypothetical protein WI69_20470 [Burkholderia diffusa]
MRFDQWNINASPRNLRMLVDGHRSESTKFHWSELILFIETYATMPSSATVMLKPPRSGTARFDMQRKTKEND